MHYGLGLLSTTSYRRVLEAARWADNVGLMNFAVPDHYLDESPAGRPTLDAFAVLAGLARETAGIELAVMLSPITFRHPAVLAKSAVTIDRMSGGRFLLGVGTGWFELEHTVMGLELPSLDERFDRLEDALGYLGAAFLPEPAAYAGRFYRLERHPVQPPPSRRVRLVVGGTGPIRTPRLAGLHADELNIHSTPVAGVAARVRRAREAAAGAGRDPAVDYGSATRARWWQDAARANTGDAWLEPPAASGWNRTGSSAGWRGATPSTEPTGRWRRCSVCWGRRGSAASTSSDGSTRTSTRPARSSRGSAFGRARPRRNTLGRTRADGNIRAELSHAEPNTERRLPVTISHERRFEFDIQGFLHLRGSDGRHRGPGLPRLGAGGGGSGHCRVGGESTPTGSSTARSHGSSTWIPASPASWTIRLCPPT